MAVKRDQDRGKLIGSVRTTALTVPVCYFLGVFGLLVGIPIFGYGISGLTRDAGDMTNVATTMLGVVTVGIGVIALIYGRSGSVVENVDFFQSGVSFGGRREKAKFVPYEELEEFRVKIISESDEGETEEMLNDLSANAAGLGALRGKPPNVTISITREGRKVNVKAVEVRVALRIAKNASKAIGENVLDQEYYSF